MMDLASLDDAWCEEGPQEKNDDASLPLFSLGEMTTVGYPSLSPHLPSGTLHRHTQPALH